MEGTEKAFMKETEKESRNTMRRKPRKKLMKEADRNCDVYGMEFEL